MDKKFVNIEIVENWKMNNVNELQTCPFRFRRSHCGQDQEGDFRKFEIALIIEP